MQGPQLQDIYSRQDIADRYINMLRYGVPELGYSGDPSLVLAFNNGPRQCWELLSHAPERGQPDRHVVIMKAPAGFELNDQGIVMLIRNLVANDTQRAGNSLEDQMDRVMKENERHDAAQTETAVAETSDALSKFYTEAGKTLGVTKTFFAT